MPSSACKKCALRSEEHTSELQSHSHLVCRLLLAKKKAGFLIAEDIDADLRGERGHRGGGRRAVSYLHLAEPPWRATAPSPAARASFFFFNDTATTEIYTLSLHDALPISRLNSSHTLISYAVFCLEFRR